MSPPTDRRQHGPFRRLSDERGSVTSFFVILTVPMVMMAGLAFDGGRILTARREAFDLAQNAALAGSQSIDEVSVRAGAVQLDTAGARAAALGYLSRQGETGVVSVNGDEVTVTVTETVDMQFLGALGVGSKTVTGTATSRLVRGITAGDQ